MTQKFQTTFSVFTAFEKFRCGNGGYEEGALLFPTFSSKPFNRFSCDPCLDFTLKVDQERRIKQRGMHGAPSLMNSSGVPIRPNQTIRGW